MLGAASGVTDSNMIQYLGIIEQRTNELLAIQSYLTTKVSLVLGSEWQDQCKEQSGLTLLEKKNCTL